MSVPFLALGLMFGASRFAHLATSMLAPSQRAAGTAAEEGTSGNISLSNTNLDNHTFHTMRGNSLQTSALTDSGMVGMRLGDGAMAHRAPDGSESVFKDRAFSDPGFNVNWGSRLSQGIQERTSEARSHATAQAERASESFGTALNQSLAFNDTLQNSRGFSQNQSHEERQIIANSASQIQQAAERLSETTGWSQQQSLRMLGRAAVDLGTPLKGIIGSGVNLQTQGDWTGSGTSREDWSKVTGIAEEFGIRESFEKLHAASQTISLSDSQSELADLRDSISTSHSNHLTAEQSLNETLSTVQSYENTRTAFAEDSGGFSANLNQQALEIGAEQYGGNIADAYQAAKANPQLAQEWADEAIDRYLDRMDISNTTPETLKNNTFETSKSTTALRYDVDKDRVTMRAEQDVNTASTALDTSRTTVQNTAQSLGSQMTNSAATIGQQVTTQQNTAGSRIETKSDYSLAEGATNAVLSTPQDAIDVIEKYVDTPWGSDQTGQASPSQQEQHPRHQRHRGARPSSRE